MTSRRARSIRPTKQAIAIALGALLLFGVGTNVQAGWVLAIAALLLGILVAGLVLPLRNLRGIVVSRSAPRTVHAGDAVPVTLAVRNGSSQLRALLRLSDDFLGRAYAVVDVLQPGQTREYVAERAEARRGVHLSGVCVIETGAPFGVLRIRKRLEVESQVIVYPRVYDAKAWRLRGPAGFPAPSSLGDVSSVRDYRPGDPSKHIHWRSVARRGQLMVREFDNEVSATTAVFSDVPAFDGVADAIATVACSIAKAALSDGEVAVGGHRTRSLDVVLDWGARLGSVPVRSASLMDHSDRADAVVYVGTPELAPVDRLRMLAAQTSVSAVIVDDGTGAIDQVASQLRGAGAMVATIRAEEVEPWFRNGCPAS